MWSDAKALKTGFIENNGQSGPLSVVSKTQGNCQLWVNPIQILLEEMLPWTILEEQVPVTRNTATGKISNGVLSLLWQIRRYCNTNHNKFSSLSNTTVVTIFSNLRLWRRSLCSNLVDIDSERLDRTSLVSPKLSLQYMPGFGHATTLLPVSLVSAKNAWDYNSPFVY